MIRSVNRACAVVLAVAWAAAGGIDASAAGVAGQPVRATGRDVPFEGRLVDQSKAAADTVVLMGPWGSGAPFNGQFQSAGGAPAWNGWTSRDESTDTAVQWHVDSYRAVNGDFSLYCGDPNIARCSPTDSLGGYGPAWYQTVELTAQVPDNTQPCTITFDGWLNHDTEPGYDYTYLVFPTAGLDFNPVWSYSGQQDGIHLVEAMVYQPGDYVGPNADQVAVRLTFVSDGAFDDATCFWPTHGALQVDDITVSVSQGSQVFFDDFEDGTLGNWQPRATAGVGDFAALRGNLRDLDPCHENSTPQVSFIDDGVVVPGTGGSPCLNWCYGPGGYIVNTTGGLAPQFELENSVVSPVMPWPNADYEGITLAFDAYSHEDLSADAPGIFYRWDVRSTTATDPAGIEGALWHSSNVYLYGGPWYLRHEQRVSNLVARERNFVQVKLTVFDAGATWGYNGDDGYPAPYFDNVRVIVYPFDGPGLSASEIHLAEDAFPTQGVLDLADLGSNSVRFDMAANIANAWIPLIDPGDSIVVTVDPVRRYATLVGLPRLYYRLLPNPVFDPYRTAGLPNAGFVASLGALGSDPDRFAFDLPDTGFLFPGDVLRYYISAVDQVGADQRRAILPADTTGFSGPDTDEQAYDAAFTVRALPSVRPDGFGGFVTPSLLHWNDNGKRGTVEEWKWAYRHLGLQLGLDYDIYTTNQPTSNVGNSLGERAATAQLEPYTELVYTAGSLGWNSLGNGDNGSWVNPANDVALLKDWLDLGSRDLLLTGSGIASALSAGGGEAAVLLGDYLGLSVSSDDVSGLIGNQAAALALALPGNPVFMSTGAWIAYDGCLAGGPIDAVTAVPTAQRLAEFADPAGQAGMYPYAAAVLNTVGSSRVTTFPYDLAEIWTDPAVPVPPLAARTRVLGEVLAHFGFDGTPLLPSEVPSAELFTTSQHPNPFNPTTRISFHLPRAGHLSLKVFDLRGQLVRTLRDGFLAAGPGHADWDGRTDQGEPAASGIYFYEARAMESVLTGKMTLLK